MAVAEAQARPAGRAIPRPSARHVLVLLLAVAAGVANVILLRSADTSVPIVVAAAEVASGTRIGPEHLAVSEVAADGDLVGRFIPEADQATLVGQVATRTIAAGDPLLAGDLVSGSETRAMSIPVTVDVAVGGTLVPGDLVDVIAVDDDGATYLAEGLAVLAVPADDGLGGLDFAPTVAVDADTALRIAEALDKGSIHLVRSTGTGDA
jgi:Flp pilus assembly protein CpaB